ncbi:N(2)-acetyl-L-2,4-diaminobutanoate deacetylase DoeB [Acetobacter fallax]|uniref:N-alpha-acetyl diaminobutyric acid deacetylase DoeB n=1 Tax=Acetobacter fallax TaxID=1737473 RepID=A0ABX0KES4_9PROT|nr:N(2)-acetyl-L-2,4-diaminobutanoate deacetylase DoeB [Acetobacter fallax]NHO33989.1 N-alpha-acetyl diaminobutyric acid deacetylase DoeB [Acetobacter fallax]NHO37523.1 N-alpha-acetyl diaminobutyric acid deacetylase DoeB [Acetobacter fallax]
MTGTLLDSPIVATIPFDQDGVHHGFLRLPYSRDDSAWGSVMIPITVVRNGEGSTALLTGGNHGDEYEGPVALFSLAQELNFSLVSGCVIIVPAMNYPAFRAGTRTSPIDRGNMNRIFPGRPDGTVTEKIADYFQRVLLPMSDIVLDFHSGGKTLDFIPFAAAHMLPDREQEKKCFAAVKAFGAPYSLKMVEIDSRGMFDTAIEEMGKVFITTELGGGGTVSARTAGIARRGVMNVLRHFGIVAGDVSPATTRWLDMPGDDSFVFAEQDGLLEMLADLGEPVKKGGMIARIHCTDRMGVAPAEIAAPCDGLLIARHFPGLIRTGDCVASFGVLTDEA